MKKKIAIVGSGISGLTAGFLLHKLHDITLFEAAPTLGGHTATVEVEQAGRHYAIDTGFIVFNDRTYPNFLKLLERIGVGRQPAEMSFSVKSPEGMEYNGHNLDEEIVRSILTFSFFITMTIGVLALCLALLGLDPITALTGAATAVCNVGPGLGEIIGPAGNFSTLPDTAKWLLSIGMLLGRLEIITVLVLLTPAFWRH